MEKKIYYHDTDCGGVVYYANYLKHFEEARTEYFSGKGVDLKGLSEKGVWFVVQKVEINYKSPARYQDTIRILTAIEDVRVASINFFQKIFRDEALLVEAKTTLVCVGNDLRPVQIPAEIKKALPQ